MPRSVLLLVLTSAPASAQQFLDAGAFVIVRGGAEAGREEYAIRPAAGRGGEGGLLSVSTTRVPGRETQAALELQSDFTLVSFQSTESAGGRVTRRVGAQVSGRRLTLRITAPEGEATREFAARSPLVVLADEQSSAFYFMPRPDASEPRQVNVLRARDGRMLTATVRLEGPDSVSVAGRRLGATRYKLALEDGDERLFWFTGTGDLVQVSIPATGTVATRERMHHQ